MPDRELARRLVLQKSILDQLKAANQADRDALDLQPGDALSVLDEAGHVLGRTRVDAGRSGWRITDRDALVDWLAEHHPDVLATRVEVTIPAAVETALTAAGGLVDEATGEIVTPPGLSLVEAKPRLVVTSTPAAEALAMALLVSRGAVASIGGPE